MNTAQIESLEKLLDERIRDRIQAQAWAKHAENLEAQTREELAKRRREA